MKKSDPVVTKSMLESVLYERFEKFGKKVDERFKAQDERSMQYRDQILDRLDEVMAELENHREERDFLKYDIKQLDGRVTKLENPAKIA